MFKHLNDVTFSTTLLSFSYDKFGAIFKHIINKNFSLNKYSISFSVSKTTIDL